MRYTFADLIAAAQALEAIERMKADLAEFAQEHGIDDDGVINFLEISGGDAFNVTPAQAIGYFTAKGLRPTFSYADMLGQAHDQAFTVAKMMDVDLLGQVKASLDTALASGKPFHEWKAEIGPVLKAAGWWGDAKLPDPLTGQLADARLGSAWRLETIFRTNMQTAYAAGQWRQIEAQADIAPFLLYDAVDDLRTRPLHHAWDNTILPVDSPWWRTHYPPNGYNCRCGVIQLDADQLAGMGMTPQADPPAEGSGSYRWKNPRTGQEIDVPDGIDPGFDRNPGDALVADLRELLAQKVAALPPGSQAAIAPVLKRQFDTTTDAGRWHKPAFNDAPDWLRDKVIDMQAVHVERASKSGAFARGGFMIDMDGEDVAKASGQAVWRHEMGHVMDARLGKLSRYRSSEADFLAAQKGDGDLLAAAAGNGRKSKANDALRARVTVAYSAVRDTLVDAERAARPAILRQMAADAGLDFAGFVSVVRDSTNVLEGLGDLEDVGVSVRLARMIAALRLGDGEGFVRWASFKDAVEDMVRAGRYDASIVKDTSQSWRKDGSLAKLSDLIGSATRNRAANYHDGFPGHSNAYYKRGAEYAPTESWANLTSLAGHSNAFWWEITQRLAPRMSALYREILEGTA